MRPKHLVEKKKETAIKNTGTRELWNIEDVKINKIKIKRTDFHLCFFAVLTQIFFVL